MTFDSHTFDTDTQGNQRGKTLDGTYKTHDGKTVDSTGAYLIGELERLDQNLYKPLVDTTWSRDIDLREDVSIADEVTSFILTTYASQGGLGTGNGIGNGKSWIGKSTDQISGINVDNAKIPHPLRLWALELKFTIPELESSIKAGRPIDQQKYEGMQTKHDMDIDEQVYIGDNTFGDTGLVNSSAVTPTNVPAGVGGTRWSLKTPAEILADVNFAITQIWTATGFAVMPNRILIPPVQYGALSSAVVSTAGNISILNYLTQNNIVKQSGRGELQILPLKWLVGAGVGGVIGQSGTVDRMVVYVKEKRRVRFPMTILQRTPVQYMSIYQMTVYFCRLGVVEVVYPSTIGYFDMI